MSGLNIGYKGMTVASSGIGDGWKWIKSESHIAHYWTGHTKDGRYTSGGWRPTITIKRKGWWRLLVVGIAFPGNGVTINLGPVLIEWDRRYIGPAS